MRKVVALAAVALTVSAVGACSTKSKSADNPASTPSGPASTKLGQGVTATTIKLGIAYVDLAAIRNLINIDHGDYQAAYGGVIDDINAHGGINGRKIVPVFAPVNPVGTAPAAAACTKLTEDEKVFAVVGFFQGDNALCYVKTHDVPIIGTSLTPAQEQVAKQPAFDDALSPEHLAAKEIPALQNKGVFDGHKVAVVGGTADETALRDSIVPGLKKAGVDVVQTAIEDAPATDTTALYHQYALIAQKFQSAGADVVVAVQQSAGAWPRALQVNHSSYRPRLVATRVNDLQTYLQSKEGYDPAIVQNAVAASSTLVDMWSDPAMRTCIARLRADKPNDKIGDPATATADTPQTWVAPFEACQYVTLFADIARAAGKALNNDTFLRGGESLKNVTLPGAPIGLDYGPGHHDGDGAVYIYQYNPKAQGLLSLLK